MPSKRKTECPGKKSSKKPARRMARQSAPEKLPRGIGYDKRKKVDPFTARVRLDGEDFKWTSTPDVTSALAAQARSVSRPSPV